MLDPATEIVYFFSKGYKGGASSGGVLNGIYKFFAVDIHTLNDVPGFPITIDGHNADNDPTRYFLGGTVLQRPVSCSPFIYTRKVSLPRSSTTPFFYRSLGGIAHKIAGYFDCKIMSVDFSVSPPRGLHDHSKSVQRFVLALTVYVKNGADSSRLLL